MTAPAEVYSTLTEDEDMTVWRRVERKDKGKPSIKDIRPVMNRNEAHEKWGHLCKTNLEKTAEHYGIKLQGKLTGCTGCGLVKARAAGVSKTMSETAKEKGFRLFIDTTGPFPESRAGNKYFHCAVDDHTDYAWVYFTPRKSTLPTFIEDLLTLMTGREITIKYIRCDNAGEHMTKLREICNKNGITLEYTAPRTPQQNGRVERKITIIWKRAMAMMVHARMKKEFQAKFWGEAVSTSCVLGNLTLGARNEYTPYEAWTGRSPVGWMSKLVQFGRVGYIAKKDQVNSKMKPKGLVGVMMGYALDHPKGTYKMYNVETNRIILSRDITWHDFKKADAPKDLDMFYKKEGVETTLEAWDGMSDTEMTKTMM